MVDLEPEVFNSRWLNIEIKDVDFFYSCLIPDTLPGMSVTIQPEEKKCGDKIVFGTCNHYFTQYRKYRQWDSQVL